MYKNKKNKHVKCVQSKICGVLAAVALQILNSLLSTSTTGVSPLNKAQIVKLSETATQKYTRCLTSPAKLKFYFNLQKKLVKNLKLLENLH